MMGSYLSLDNPNLRPENAAVAIPSDRRLLNKALLKEARKILKKSSEQNPAIIQAVRGDNPAVLRVLATLKPETINERDSNGDTALHVGIREGYFEMVHVLLDFRPVPDITNEEERTPLHEVALINHPLLAKRLLSLWAYPDAADKQLVTPLIIAARVGALGVVRVLLKYQAEPDLMDASFRKALDYAKDAGYEAIVEALLPRLPTNSRTETFSRVTRQQRLNMLTRKTRKNAAN